MQELTQNLQTPEYAADVWQFDFVDAAGGEPTLAARLARAVQAAEAEGLEVESVRIGVKPAPNGTRAMAMRVKGWLKKVGRICRLRAYWPRVFGVACPAGGTTTDPEDHR